MRRQIPDDADVGLVKAQVDALEEMKRPPTGGDEIVDRHHRRAVEERVPGHEDEPERRCEPRAPGLKSDVAASRRRRASPKSAAIPSG